MLVLLALAAILVSVPGAVNAMKRLFGYIPGAGVVEQGAPLRVLAEPVSITRDGITVSVNRAYLTPEKTILDSGVSGVPLSAYPKGEAVTGCIEPEYLRLPDGTRVELYAPLPAGVSQAVFVMPCIFNTLSGTVPTDWELPLRFVPAPPELTVMPVVEVAGTTPVVTLPAAVTLPATETLAPPKTPLIEPTMDTRAPVAIPEVSIRVEKVIETGDGYILIGVIHPQLPGGARPQVTGVMVIRDASGKKVAYTFPQNINEYDLLDLKDGELPFSLQVKAAGVAFPLTITIPGVVVSPADPQATAEFEFDAGADPQPGQEWKLDQDIQIGGHTLRLVSVTADSRNGYSFEFKSESGVSGVSVQIEGYTPIGGGGGGPGYQGQFTTSLSFPDLPRGKLKIILSNLTLASETQFWQGQWQPDSPRPWPTAPAESASPVCLNADSLQALKPLPAGLDGKALVTGLNPDLQLVLASFDGSQRQVLVQGGSRGSLSADGARLAYPADAGITILDLASGDTSTLKGIQGRDLRWSPDGSRIAYVTAGDAYGIFIIATDGKTPPRQLSNLGYESIAGWSPDGKVLYFAIPGASSDGFLLRAADVASGEVRDLFVLKDSSRKAPMPAVSLDGGWIAYRGADNASLYLVRIDGSGSRKLIESISPGYAISGIAWGPGGGLLGVSLLTPESQDGVIILLQPDGCEAYLLPSLQGELDGLIIP